MLAVEHAGGERDAEYSSDGRMEAVIAQVSTVTGLDVIRRTPLMQCKRIGVSVLEIGRCPS